MSLEHIQSAAGVLAGVANRTPVMTSRALNAQLGCHAAFKCECLQRTGSFKFRGAYNFLTSLNAAERSRGVCTVSSGNHAQALALAAREFGVKAAILMPEDAPAVKLAATRAYGADVVTYDRYSRPQAEAGAAFSDATEMTFVPAFDDPRIASGAGTAMLELAEEVGPPDVLLAPVGGGGGIAGYATVVKALNPRAKVYAVEPRASAVASRSLRSGQRVEISVRHHIADGQMLTSLGEFTFEVMRAVVDEVLLVSDEQIVNAMAFLFERMKLVTEPSGAIATAALLHTPLDLRGKSVAVVISGGNIGTRRFADLVVDGVPSAPLATRNGSES